MGRVVVVLSGLALIGYAAGLVFGSPYFPVPGGEAAVGKYVVLFTVATLAATILHVGACVIAHRTPPKLRHVLIIAAAARLILIVGGPGPILEGDRGRLRFEGRMVNQGLNPYEFTPAHLADAHPDDALLDDMQLERLQQARATMTASGDGPRPEELQRPDLRTSTPPAGLWLAAVADFMKPESTRGYAFLILCFDVLAGFMLVLALRRMGLPLGWLIIYAWCPVLLKEAYTTYSIDIFVVAGLAGLVYCIAANRKLAGALPLAICIAFQPVMVFLVPALWRRMGGLGVLLGLALAMLTLLPFSTPFVPAQNFLEGQVHVWRDYEYNSAAENLFRGLLRHLPQRAENSLTIANVEIVRPDQRVSALLAKLACLVILLGVVTYTVIRVRPDTELPGMAETSALSDVFVVCAALLVVSPVLQPNHALWLLPLLVVRRCGLAWLALPGIVSLSYLTHLAGPDAADLVLAGGSVSFRIFEFGAFLALVLVDLVWRDRLFVDADEEIMRHYRPAASERVDSPGFEPVAIDDEEPVYLG